MDDAFSTTFGLISTLRPALLPTCHDMLPCPQKGKLLMPAQQLPDDGLQSPAPLRVGLALGSGGARGWAHLGVLDEFIKAGLPIHMLAGASAGALVGAAFATGRLRALHERVLQLDWREIFTTVRVRFSRGGIITGEGIISELERLGVDGAIEDAELPFAAVATDLMTGAEVWLRRGDIRQAVHASIAIPGIIAPVRMDNRWLADGGLVNPVPVSLLRAMGADIIIAVSLDPDVSLRRTPAPPQAGSKLDPLKVMADYMPAFLATPLKKILPDVTRVPSAPGYVDVIGNALDIVSAQITRARLAGDPPHVLVRPLLPDVGTFDFDRGEEIIEAGREAAKMALPHIRQLLKRLQA
jgi:NTE family protein